MIDKLTNDNDSAHPARAMIAPDPNGQAAMLLVESLLHGLVARSLLTVQDAVEIVQVAAEVELELAVERTNPSTPKIGSLALLNSIRRSLKGDLYAEQRS